MFDKKVISLPIQIISLIISLMSVSSSELVRPWGHGDVVHNYHNFRPSEFLLLIAIAMAEVPTPNLLAISAIEIPVSRLKYQAISVLTPDTLLL
jgi:hypothetical protein